MKMNFKEYWTKTQLPLTKEESDAIDKALAEKQDNLWAICHAQGLTGDKYESCVLHVKDKMGMYKDMNTKYLVTIKYRAIANDSSHTWSTEIITKNDGMAREIAVNEFNNKFGTNVIIEGTPIVNIMKSHPDPSHDSSNEYPEDDTEKSQVHKGMRTTMEAWLHNQAKEEDNWRDLMYSFNREFDAEDILNNIGNEFNVRQECEDAWMNANNKYASRKSQIQKAYEQEIEEELKGSAHYAELAAKDPENAEAFLQMAMDEIRHRHALENINMNSEVKTMDVSSAGPVPESLLASQDLEGKVRDTTFKTFWQKNIHIKQ